MKNLLFFVAYFCVLNVSAQNFSGIGAGFNSEVFGDKESTGMSFGVTHVFTQSKGTYYASIFYESKGYSVPCDGTLIHSGEYLEGAIGVLDESVENLFFGVGAFGNFLFSEKTLRIDNNGRKYQVTESNNQFIESRKINIGVEMKAIYYLKKFALEIKASQEMSSGFKTHFSGKVYFTF